MAYDELAGVDGPAAPIDEMDFSDDDVDEAGKVKNITKDGGIVKTIITPGSGWETPETGDEVTVHYVGTLEDGTKFDSSRDRDSPFTFTIGKGQVIKGWDQGVATMKKGEKSLLKCAAAYAYGEQGSPPKIPANATLNFEVELISWRSVKDISHDGGVIKTVVKEGDGWENPKERDEVLVVYKARVKDTEEFTLVSPEEGVEFVVEEGAPCKGLAVAVKTMKKGEQVMLVLQPDYAFNETGHEAGSIPPNSVVEMHVELVSWKKVEDITEDGLVVKKTLVSSSGYKTPNEGASVTIKYTIKTLDGEEIAPQREFTFTTDEEAVVEGLELGVMKMKEGEVARVTVDSKYLNGPEAVELPAGTTVVYEVELAAFTNSKETWEMKEGEKIEAANVKKEKGNAAFKAGKLSRAVHYYSKAEALVQYDKNFDEGMKAQCKEIKKSCYLNLAAVQLKEGKLKECIKNCNKALDIDPVSMKALYRRAQAYMNNTDFVEAEMDIKNALGLEPQNAEFASLLKKLKVVSAAQNKKEAQLYGRMFAPKTAVKAN